MSSFFPRDQQSESRSARDEQRGELSLLEIPGIGRSKAQTLINAGYASLGELAEASLEDLESVPGLGPRTARQVRSGAREALREHQADREPRRGASIVPLSRNTDDDLPQRTGEAEENSPDPRGAPAEERTLGIVPPAGDVEDAGAPAEDAPAREPGTAAAEAGDADAREAREVTGTEGPQVREDGALDVGQGAGVELAGTAAGARESAQPGPGEDAAVEADEESRVDVHLTVHIDGRLLENFDADLAQEYEIVPLHRVGDTLLAASEKPLTSEDLRELRQRSGLRVRPVPSQLANFDATLHNLYHDNDIRSGPKGLGEILIDMGLLTREQLSQALAQQLRENNPFFRPVLSVSQDVLNTLPEGDARKLNVLPLSRTEDTLLVATAEFLEGDRVRQLENLTGLEPQAVIVGPSELADAMTQCYRQRRGYELRQMWLGEILVSRNLITREELDKCLAAQQESSKKLGQLLIDAGHIDEDSLYPILAEKLGLEYQRIEQQNIDYQLTYLVSERFAERNLVLPIGLDYEEGVLKVAICDPTNLQVRDMLEGVAEAQGQELKLVLASPGRLKDAINYAYNFHRQIEAVTEELEIESAEGEWDEEEEASGRELIFTEDLPKMRRIVNKMLYEAVSEGASDIHIENLETRTQVRFRIDGILHERATPINKANIQKVISVLKIDSGLNIAERRRAQDGVFKMRIGQDRHIDFRINVHATQFGEDAVIRVLDRSKNLMELSNLGFSADVESRYRALVRNPQGLILITGPTGSGKTTTLYSTLGFLNTGDKKIVTAEDPVEYHLDGITQYQVNNFIGNTFAEYTKRFLRKDPDIILVGETRDDETARACIRAAMTGHLVFSTLHTNDAISVVPRPRDLGVDSSSISDALLCVIQQRLARRNCPDCRKPYQPDDTLLRDFFPGDEIPAEARFVRGTGCSTCHGKGLQGRVGLYEFWEVKRATREFVARDADEKEIRRSAEEQGMVPLLKDALRKVYAGTTTLEELRRVVPVEQIRGYSGYYKFHS